MSNKKRITVTVDEDVANILAAYEKAGQSPSEALVAGMRSFKKPTGLAAKKISPRVGAHKGA